MINIQKKIAKIDRQLAENQRRQRQQIETIELPIWIPVAAVMMTGAAIFAAGMVFGKWL